MKLNWDEILDGLFWKLLFFIAAISLMVLLTENLFAQYATNSNITEVIDANQNRYIAVASPSLTVFSTPPETTSTKLPEGFAPMYYSWVPQSTVTDCTNVLSEPPPATLTDAPEEASPTDPPESATSTEPVLPQCSSIQCPTDQTRTEAATTVTCSWNILAEDAAKKATWDSQDAQFKAVSAEYQESITYWNLQGFCNYETGKNCTQVTPAQKTTILSKLSTMGMIVPQNVLNKLGL
jgi:hypothetical protein